MRLAALTIPAGLILSAVGVGFMVAARPKPYDPVPRHPVTDEMRKETASEALAVAPDFSRPDADGKLQTLKGLTAKGPLVAIFIMDDCPCSFEAQPFYQGLYKAFGGKVSFVGITDAKGPVAKEWASHFRMPYPIIPDPSKDLMKSYGAKHSAYVALVTRDGKIDRMWPGYSQTMLNEMADEIAKLSGLPRPQMDVSEAPSRPTSGCFF